MNTQPIQVPRIILNSASCRYQGLFLFSDLHLTLEAGQWACLVGESGVGKTSLLRLIAGFKHRHGHYRSLETSDGLPLSGRVAYMTQDDRLLPWASVLDNVLIGSRLRGEVCALSGHRAQAAELLRQVGLGDWLSAKPHELSGGMRQRVALVRTLMEKRSVILMDEPFSALDVPTRHRLQSLAYQLLKGRTVLMVTHDPLEALRLSDCVYVMKGSPAILSDPIFPPGKAPRAVDEQELLKLHAKLLAVLHQAQEHWL